MADLRLWTSSELLRLKHELDSKFNELCRDFGACGLPGGIYPELSQTPEALVVTAPLPDVEPEDVGIDATEDTLTLSVRVRREVDTPDARVTQSGTRTTSLRLPCRVDVERTRAELEGGVLTITLPRLETPRSRTLIITRR